MNLLFPGLNAPLPELELIAAVQDEIEHASREEYEAWRFEISEAFRQSGVFLRVAAGVMAWAEREIAAGCNTIEVARGTSGGLMLSAFQLGYLVAKAQTVAAIAAARGQA